MATRANQAWRRERVVKGAVLLALAMSGIGVTPSRAAAQAGRDGTAPEALPGAQAAAPDVKPLGGVRVLESNAGDLIREARLRSSIVERLLAELGRSDVVVYVHVRLMPRCATGRLRFLGAAGRLRYVKVEIAANNRTEHAIAWLGHELQHALEVAASTDVRDEKTLQRLYERIGGPNPGRVSHYETDAAISTGRKVAAEVQASVGASGVTRPGR